jgi:magnesium chelatase family protein
VCGCLPGRLAAYAERLSGPVLDRIDLRVTVDKLKKREIFASAIGDPSHVVRSRVMTARAVQEERLAPFGVRTNAEIPPQHLEQACGLTAAAKRVIENSVERDGLSARGVHRVMRVGRTIADQWGEERVSEHAVHEAVNFRMNDVKR